MRLVPTAVPLAAAALLAAGCVHAPSAQERKTAEIHHDLAVEALRKGLAQDALREYDAALQSDPGMAEAHRGRGLVLEHAFKRHAEAEAEFRKAIDLKARFSEAHNDLGQLLAQAGRYQEAIAQFDEALASAFYLEPWVARLNKGLTLWRMGKKEEGVAELKTCLAAAPKYCAARKALGGIQLEEGRLGEALETYGTYARDCEGQPDAHLQLGLARLKAGDAAGARASLQRCMELARGGPAGDECRRTLDELQ